MATEYRLSHTAAQIDEKLKKIDNLAAKNDLPTKTSDLINDSDFTTENYVDNYAQPKGDYALKNDIPVVPTNVSAFNNDTGYLTEHQSLDGYATELYVDNKIDAIPTPDVSGQIDTHNVSTSAHNDIRLLIEGLTARLNALADSDDTTLDQMSEIVAYIKSNKTLIEQVTTNKVNVSDIINNLTTNIGNKPLSAAQGVALKALIDAIVVPTKVSELTNDKGYLTSYTETDPTVPSWAKAASKPKYTASEVGADASGTANSLVASHNANTSAHSDIRTLIGDIDKKLYIQDGTPLNPKEGALWLDTDAENVYTNVYIPVKGRDYFTAADKEELIQELMIAIGTPVFGTVDLNNRISLSDNHLADGTYEIGFENADGKWVSIGTYEKGASQPETTTVQLNMELGIKLSKTDNTYETVSTDHTTATGTYAASQYIDLDINATYKVGMTFSNYRSISLCFFDENNNFIAYHADVIGGTTGEEAIAMEHTIVIPDGATKVRLRMYIPINQYNAADFALEKSGLWMTKTTTGGGSTTYTNILPLAINSDGTLYNGGQGWTTGTRLNSSGVETTSNATDIEVTGFIPVKAGDKVYLSGITMNKGTYANQTYAWLYDASFNKLNGRYRLFNQLGEDSITAQINSGKLAMDGNGNVTMFTISGASAATDMFVTGSDLADINNTAYLRISCEHIDANSIITVNEPITDEPSTYTNLADPTSADWLYEQRINSSGSVVSTTSVEGTTYTTNYIPVKAGDVVRVKGLDVRYYSTTLGNSSTHFYNANKSRIGYVTTTNNSSYDATNATVVFTVQSDLEYASSIEYARFSGFLIDGYTANDVIITVNEEITDEPTTCTNLAKPSDSNWVEGKRYNSSNVLTDFTGGVITNYIDVSGMKNYIAVKGINLKGENSRIYTYSSQAETPNNYINTNTSSSITVADYDSSVFIVPKSVFSNASNYLWRFGGPLVGTSADVIITIDEEIR